MKIADAGSTNPELIRLLADMGQSEAWKEFMGRYSPMIRSLCTACGLSRDDTEEVQAAVMLRLVQVFLSEENRIRSSFRGFLKRIIGHEIYRFLLDKNRLGVVGTLQSTIVDQLASRSGLFEAELERIESSILTQLEAMQRVLAAVEAKVSKPTWKTFWAITVQGMPVAAAAELLKVPYLTAYQRNLRVMELIRQHVGLKHE